jgi:ribosomal protein S18 acetylase RimI-like enzyme
MSAEAPVEIVRVRAGQLTTSVTESVAALLQELVAGGAALGWVEPPPAVEVRDLVTGVAADGARGDAALVLARCAGELVGVAWWRRYARATHRPHADLEKLAVGVQWHSRGIGRALLVELITAAVEAQLEVLTLDLRGDNQHAVRLYESVGFHRYGLLERFVAVGAKRYDELFYALDLRDARD